MTREDSNRSEVALLFPNVMPMVILAAMSVILLALSPWGIDPLYSGITHFLTLWPLLLLAILTYVAKVKLADSERDVPEW